MIKTVNESIQSIQKSLNEILSIHGKSFRRNDSLESKRRRMVDSTNPFTSCRSVPYWLGEVERVVDEPGSSWGRGLQDPARLSCSNGCGKPVRHGCIC